MTKFRDLQESDFLIISGFYNDSTITKTQAKEALAETFGVHKRTIEKWVEKIGGNDRLEKIYDKAGSGGNKTGAKILILDIETAPMRSYIWTLWNMNVGSNLAMLQADWFMLTWSAKWLFEEKVYSDKLEPHEVLLENDKRIVQSMWDMLNEADVVIAHNGKRFDVKKLNTRFLVHSIPPPMPYQVIDTLEHVKRQFAISSNKLDYVAKFLGIGAKVQTGGFDLWKRCMQGDVDALRDMEVYNIGDVTLLEEVYLAIRGWIKPHPNMGLFIAEDVSCCPTCSSTSLSWGGTYKTYANAYDAFRCDDCGAVGRSRKTAIPRASKELLTISVP